MFYPLARTLFRIIAAPMFRFSVHGVERVPKTGPGVVVAPHRSWLDPACVGGAFPRPIRFLILENVYDKPWARWFYRLMRSLPVRPGGGGRSIASLRGALRLLQQGELVGVFPEGRVISGGALGPFAPGAAMLAVRVHAPVIPVVIKGSAKAWPHGRCCPGPARVTVQIGAPIVPESGRGREPVARLLQRIEVELREMAATAEAG